MIKFRPLNVSEEHSLRDLGCQQDAQRVAPDYRQIPAAVWTLLASVRPAELARDDLEAARGLVVAHPVVWEVRAGWQRTETFTPRYSFMSPSCGELMRPWD